jgi:malate synthase
MPAIEIGYGINFPEKFWTHEFQEIFPPELLKFLAELHEKFEPSRQELLQSRRERQSEYDRGKFPEYQDKKSESASGNWQVAPIPPELMCRRVEITGPVHSAKMVINMLSRNEQGVRADMAMLDFEDSMKPSFGNVLNGYKNVIQAVAGNLSHYVPGESGKAEKIYRLNPQDMAYVMVRCRGLHLTETNIKINNTPISAGLLDLAVCFFHTAKIYKAQNKSPKYYIPKC